MNAQIAAPKRNRRSPTAGNKNQGSNWISKKRRAQIYTRDGHRCIWCTGYPERLSLDHVIARARGGTNRTDNLITSCLKCNAGRGERSFYQYALSKAVNPIAVILRVLAALDKPLDEVA